MYKLYMLKFYLSIYSLPLKSEIQVGTNSIYNNMNKKLGFIGVITIILEHRIGTETGR